MATVDSLASLPEYGRPSTGLRVMESKLASEKKNSQLTLDNKPNGESISDLSRESLQDQDNESAEALRRRQDEVDEVTKEAAELARRHEQEMTRLQAEAAAKQQAEIKMEAEALARRHAEENARLEAEKLARRQVEEEQARKEQAEAARRRRERAEAHLRRREQERERERVRAAKVARPVRDDETDSSGADDPGGKRTNGTIIKNLFLGRSGSTSSNSGQHHYRQLSQDAKTFSMSRDNGSRSKQRAASQSQAREADLAEFLDKGPPIPLKPATPEKSLPPPPPPTRYSLQRKPVPRPVDDTESVAASRNAGFPQRTTSLTKRPKAAPPDATPFSTSPSNQITQAPLIAPKPVPTTTDTTSDPIHLASDKLSKPHPPLPNPPHPNQPAAPIPSPSQVILPTPHPSVPPSSTTDSRRLPHSPNSTSPAPAPSPHHCRKSSSAQDLARLRSLIANANAERDDAIAEVERLKGLVRDAGKERAEARAEVVRVKDMAMEVVGELRGVGERLGGVLAGAGAGAGVWGRGL